MQHFSSHDLGKSLKFDGADLEVRAQMGEKCLTIDIMKSGTCVHRVTVNDVTGPLEHSWIANLFAGEHKVELGALVRDVDDYLGNLDVNQG